LKAARAPDSLIVRALSCFGSDYIEREKEKIISNENELPHSNKSDNDARTQVWLRILASSTSEHSRSFLPSASSRNIRGISRRQPTESLLGLAKRKEKKGGKKGKKKRSQREIQHDTDERASAKLTAAFRAATICLILGAQ
jgi:hypothetical protein